MYVCVLFIDIALLKSSHFKQDMRHFFIKFILPLLYKISRRISNKNNKKKEKLDRIFAHGVFYECPKHRHLD